VQIILYDLVLALSSPGILACRLPRLMGLNDHPFLLILLIV